jgi:DNA-binding transcriptional ArsR family regulator
MPRTVNTDLAVRALAHPTRPRILRELADGGTMSPKQLAEQLDEPLGNVSYHVRTLKAAGLLTLDRKVPRRGAVEHYYRLNAKRRGQLADQLVAIAALMRNGGDDA